MNECCRLRINAEHPFLMSLYGLDGACVPMWCKESKNTRHKFIYSISDYYVDSSDVRAYFGQPIGKSFSSTLSHDIMKVAVRAGQLLKASPVPLHCRFLFLQCFQNFRLPEDAYLWYQIAWRKRYWSHIVKYWPLYSISWSFCRRWLKLSHYTFHFIHQCPIFRIFRKD
jgi:hypothetical protein